MHNELVKEYATKEFKTVTENVEEKLGFRIFFIGNGDYDVEVVEVHEIDFADVKRRLEDGESVFISGIQPQEKKPELFEPEHEDLWFFSHI